MAPGARPSRGGSIRSGRHLRQSGVVVQAVLLTVLVMAISLLTVVSRVASSRDAAAASSLAAAARQAAEFGFSEIVAEMNRDSKSYLWITPFTPGTGWPTVSQQDLQACGIYAPTAPEANPIEGVTTSKSLPDVSTLSYQLTDFRPPTGTASCAGVGAQLNLNGGSAMLKVVGRAMAGSGSSTTFTLQREVSVGPAISGFQWSALASPRVSPTTPRWPTMLLANRPPLSSLPGLSALPDLTCVMSGTTTYVCTDGPSGTVYGFDNAGQKKFPWLNATGSPLAPFCLSGAGVVQCRLSSLVVGGALSKDAVDLMVTTVAPVSIFIDSNLQVFSGSRVCSHGSDGAAAASVTACAAASGDWQALRLYGQDGSCSVASPPSPQRLQLSADSQDANWINVRGFIWFPIGQLTVGGYGNPSNVTAAALPGRVCGVSPSFPSLPDQRIWPDRIVTRDIQPWQYRGYGSTEVQAS